jgi:hypothetical protein
MAKQSAAPRLPQAIHVDELIGGAERDVVGVIELFLLLVRDLSADSRLMGILVWPLGSSESLRMELPTPLTPRLTGSVEPPSLYVIDRQSALLYEPVEEYRRPLERTTFGITDERVTVYYRCFRSAEAMNLGWEYEAALYFEHYPEGLIV